MRKSEALHVIEYLIAYHSAINSGDLENKGEPLSGEEIEALKVACDLLQKETDL